MKRFCFLIFLIVSLSLHGQVLEVPTLKSKGINGKVKTIEWHSFQAVKDKGEVYVKKDVETYDDQGRLSSILTQNFTNNQSFKTIYTVDKKGVLQQVQIVNPSNNTALRTTGYEYKKGLLVKTTQSQGVNTIVKNYSYNKSDQLIKVEVIQNGTVSLEEFYELDNEDRRTKISRKLPTDTEAKVTSTFTYELNDGFLTSIENRSTEQGEFTITKTTEVSSKRDTKEVTKRLSDGVQGINSQFFEDDDQGNWIKGEVIGDQYSRSRLVLRKFTYQDGLETGRDKMTFPEDYHGQFIRQYSQKQVAVNGKVYNSGVAFNLDYTDDRLSYVADLNAWILLKNYDKKTSMTAWDKAEVIAGGKDQVLWTASSAGIDVFNKGRKFIKDGGSKYSYNAKELGGSQAVYIKGDINKSFIAEYTADHAGKVQFADLTTNHFYWAKVSDSTYVLSNRGRSVGLQKQIEDSNGNKLAMYQQGSFYYWYFMPGFRDKYDNQPLGSIHQAESILDTEKFLQEGKLKVDFSSYAYTKLANSNYRLLSADNRSITNIASRTFKTPDDQLVTYFPLTGQYLKMEKFYDLEKGKEWTGQKVSVVSDSTAYVYYLYNDNESINFYTPEGRIEKRAFDNNRLFSDKRVYGAVVYDSTNNISYGMKYDLDLDSGFGPMRKLIANGRGAYALKLEGNSWVIFEKGIAIEDYTFSRLSKDGSIVHFFKDNKGRTAAMVFPDFNDAEIGQFIYANESFKTQLDEYLKEFGIDPDLKKRESSTRIKGTPLTFDVVDKMFYARDEEGWDIGERLSLFITTDINNNLITYDSVSRITYLARNFQMEGETYNGKLEVMIRPDQIKALKVKKDDVLFSIGGVWQRDISRLLINRDIENGTQEEILYDKSEDKTFVLNYPVDSSFYLDTPELQPASHKSTYVFRTSEKNFVMVEKGVIVGNEGVQSRELGEDLIGKIPIDGGVLGYRFRGYKGAELFSLIPAEKIQESEFEELWRQAGDALISQPELDIPYGVAVPNDKWMAAINRCGANQKCIAGLIDQMGVALKNRGIKKDQIELTLIPYLVGVGVQSKDRLFDVFMVLKSDYIGTMTNTKFPAELRKYIRDKSSGVVSDYTKKYGSQKIKTVPYKGKKGGNL